MRKHWWRPRRPWGDYVSQFRNVSLSPRRLGKGGCREGCVGISAWMVDLDLDKPEKINGCRDIINELINFWGVGLRQWCNLLSVQIWLQACTSLCLHTVRFRDFPIQRDFIFNVLSAQTYFSVFYFLANFHCTPSVLMVDELLSAYPHQLSFSEAGMRIMITSHFSPRTRLTMASRMLINEVLTHWTILGCVVSDAPHILRRNINLSTKVSLKNWPNPES